MLSFALALAAFCVQNTTLRGRVLLAVVLGVVGAAGGGTLLFFWHAWRGPRTEEVGAEDVMQDLAYGWGSKARSAMERTENAVREAVEVLGEAKGAVKRKVGEVRQSAVWMMHKEAGAAGKIPTPSAQVQTV